MKPQVIVCAATSLDGGTTGFPVDLALFYSLAQQWAEDATLVGSNTIIQALEQQTKDSAAAGEHSCEAAAEDEAGSFGASGDASDSAGDRGSAPESCNGSGGAPEPTDRRPLLVVADSREQIRDWHYLRTQPYWRGCLTLVSEHTPLEHVEYLEEQGVDWIRAGAERVDFKQALEQLGAKFGVTTVRVDSGGTLNGVLLRAGLVDELHLLVHPVLVGAAGTRRFFEDTPAVAKGEAGGLLKLELLSSQQLDQGLMLLSYAVGSPG